DRLRGEQDRAQAALAALRVRLGDLRGRVEVLEGLEQALEGLGTGVREVLSRLTTEPALADVAGLVADLLTVPREVAPLVELALGDAAQRFVVRDPARVDAVAAALGDVAGRVGFVPIQRSEIRDQKSERSVDSASGLLNSDFCPLSSEVACDRPELDSLPAQLLGTVLVADTLAAARRLAAQFPTYRVITRTGELLEPDGTLTVGPLRAGPGIVSRKSELRDLRGQARALADQVAAAEASLADLRRRSDALDGTIEAVETEIDLLSGEAGDLQQKIVLQQQQATHHHEQAELARAEARLLEDQVRQGEAAWLAEKQEADLADAGAAELAARLEELKAAIQAGAADRERLQQAHTAAQVGLNRATADRDRLRD
ncbi:MAG: hypothetical protein K2X91_12295, partial [Thermoleophilia bacterium]|nr:hypothetical protein [Thermoleophilia bacterium]